MGLNMPYIDFESKKKFALALSELMSNIEEGCTPGELNYLVTKLCITYVMSRGLNYTHLNDVVGVLESAKAEFQRRLVNPYEDLKIKANSDVYPL